ncbi:MAG: energy transducer TonB [Gillisia sp.]
MKFLPLLFLLFACFNIHSQEATYSLTEVDTAPVLGDCTDEDLKTCFENDLKTHITKTMNILKLDQGIDTKAYAQFEISAKGKVENIQVRSHDEKLTKETIRILKKLKVKAPALKNGTAVTIKHTVPVTFHKIII